MIVEGVGPKAPRPVVVAITRSDLRFLQDKATQRARYRGYALRQDSWGRGLVANPILVGLVGEHALCVHLTRVGPWRLFVDVTLRENGDGGSDVRVGRSTLQVKTRKRDYGSLLVRRVDGRRRLRRLDCDMVVSAQWDGSLGVSLCGWISAAEASLCGRLRRSQYKGADHWNLVIPDTALYPIGDLVKELEARDQMEVA